MEVDRFGIKLFLADPAAVQLNALVPVFHSWIQAQAIDDHLLVDVHDYSHVYHGPGILLVAHEGNFSLDMGEGRPGFLYYRKQALGGTLEDRFAAILRCTLQCCSLLEDEVRLQGQIRFGTGELLLTANDRLHAPNNRNAFSEFRPAIEDVMRRVLRDPEFTVEQILENFKERFAVRVRTKRSTRVKDLLGRLSGTHS